MLGSASRPAELPPGDLGEIQRLAGTHDYLVARGPHLEHETRPAIRRRDAEMESLALTDRESLRTVVRADHSSVAFPDDAALGTHTIGEPPAGIPVGDETDVVAVGLRRHAEAARRGLGSHLRLRRGGAERKQGVRELLGGEHGQHVRLILRPCRRPVEFAVAVGIRHDRCVMSGDHRVETEVESLFEQSRELDALIASHAGVGGAPGLILSHEIVDHVELESLRKVPHVKRNSHDVGSALRVHRVLDRAATPAAGAQRAGHPAQSEMHPDYVVTRIDGAGRGNGRIDPTAHRC